MSAKLPKFSLFSLKSLFHVEPTIKMTCFYSWLISSKNMQTQKIKHAELCWNKIETASRSICHWLGWHAGQVLDMVVSYVGGTKSLPMFWFVSGFLSTSCGQRGRCARGWVWGDGNACVVAEKVTNAGGRACLGKFFFFSFFSLHVSGQRTERKFKPK